MQSGGWRLSFIWFLLFHFFPPDTISGHFALDVARCRSAKQAADSVWCETNDNTDQACHGTHGICMWSAPNRERKGIRNKFTLNIRAHHWFYMYYYSNMAFWRHSDHWPPDCWNVILCQRKNKHLFYVSVSDSSHRRRLMSIDTGPARFSRQIGSVASVGNIVHLQQARRLLSTLIRRWDSFFFNSRKPSRIPTDVSQNRFSRKLTQNWNLATSCENNTLLFEIKVVNHNLC